MILMTSSTGERLAVGSRALILVVLLGALGSSSAMAQNDRVKAGLDTWKRVGGADCHGSFADGEKQRDESPTGANLRTSRLDAAALKEVIGCGKPGGAGMPAFDEGAYTVRACYGRALGPRPD